MRSLRGGVVAGFLAVTACGTPPAPHAPVGGAMAITPATTPEKQAKPTIVQRPETVVGWVHVDDPDALLDFVGVSNAPAWAKPALEWLELLDTRQSVDVAVLVTPTEDVEVAVRATIKDARTLLDKAGKELTLEEDGDRVRIATGDGEKEKYLCDFSRPTDGVVCGTTKGVEGAAEWLRSRPAPRKDDFVRTGRGQPFLRVTTYAKPILDALSKQKPIPESEKDLAQFLNDLDTFSLELARDGGKLAFATALRLRSQGGRVAKAMLAPPTGTPPIETFQRIWQDTNAAVFAPGGGELVKLLEEVAKGENDSAEEKTFDAKVFEVLRKPVAAGYGVRVDRARAALAAVRTAKDPEKATRALEAALDGYGVVSVGADAASLQPLMKSSAARWNEDEKKKKTNPKLRESWSVRPAPAKLGLAKGSFILDHKDVDRWDAIAAATAADTPGGKTPPVRTTTSPTLFAPDGATTWIITGIDDAMVADTAKRLLTGSKAPAPKEPLFERSGVHVGGYLSTLVGAFSMHKLSLGGSSLGGKGSMPSPDTLAEIEHDLAAPRVPLPFVVYTEKRGAGGIAAFEIEGDRAAFKEIGEHLGASLSGFLLLGVFMALVNSMPSPQGVGGPLPSP